MRIVELSRYLGISNRDIISILHLMTGNRSVLEYGHLTDLCDEACRDIQKYVLESRCKPVYIDKDWFLQTNLTYPIVILNSQSGESKLYNIQPDSKDIIKIDIKYLKYLS